MSRFRFRWQQQERVAVKGTGGWSPVRKLSEANNGMTKLLCHYVSTKSVEHIVN